MDKEELKEICKPWVEGFFTESPTLKYMREKYPKQDEESDEHPGQKE